MDYFSSVEPQSTMSTHMKNALSYQNLISNLKQSRRGEIRSPQHQGQVNSVIDQVQTSDMSDKRMRSVMYGIARDSAFKSRQHGGRH